MTIENLTLVEHCMKALKDVDVDKRLLLSTEECRSDLEPLAGKWGFTFFAGPKEDVLLRFILAARQFGITTVIRATGDNPLVSASFADSVLEEHKAKGADYSNWTGAPLGTGVEIVQTEALEKALSETSEAYDHEHVTPWIYNNPGRFNLNIHEVPERYRSGRKVSVDTEGDLQVMKEIFASLYRGKPIELDELMEYLGEER